MRVREPSGRRMAARVTLARSMAFCTILRTSSAESVPPASGPTSQPSAAAAPLRGRDVEGAARARGGARGGGIHEGQAEAVDDRRRRGRAAEV